MGVVAILKWVIKILSFLSVSCFVGVTITVSLQILSRWIPFSFIWTEELTRYFFLYGICFAAPLALIRNEYINVDLLINRFSEKGKRVAHTCIYLSILLVSVILIKEGYAFTLLGNNQSSATMPFKMSVIHASMLIMGCFLFLFSLIRIGFYVANKKNPYEVEGGGGI